jgi:hypothetical protein
MVTVLLDRETIDGEVYWKRGFENPHDQGVETYKMGNIQNPWNEIVPG